MATDGSRNIDIFFRNIKIMIDGAEYVPTDADGNVVEPLIYNGTTYLPVRAVANAFGKEVKWNGESATVYLGKANRLEADNRLDMIQYTNYEEGHKDHWMEKVNGTINDYNNNIYSNGFVFYTKKNLVEELLYFNVDFPINGQYSALTGKIILPKSIETTTRSLSNCSTSETTVIITDENGVALYEATGVTASMPFSFDINVKGVNKLTVKVVTQTGNSYVALTDLALFQ